MSVWWYGYVLILSITYTLIDASKHTNVGCFSLSNKTQSIQYVPKHFSTDFTHLYILV